MKKIAVMMAHGGVGDFLMQLDLAERLELEGIPTTFLVRKNFRFLSDILESSNIESTELMRADGFKYILAVFYVWMLSLVKEVIIINSFHITHLRLPTKIFYNVARALSADVLICQRQTNLHLKYDNLAYKDGELIWQRNNRIVTHLTSKHIDEGFPILFFKKGDQYMDGVYIHIHPVASVLDKSYPPEHLLEVLKALNGKNVLFTITPDAEKWYMTDELEQFIENNDNVKFVCKWFRLEEIAGFIAGAEKFCTVNTGLLWLALILKQKVVVADIETEYEWNPEPYGAVRLLRPSSEKLSQVLIR